MIELYIRMVFGVLFLAGNVRFLFKKTCPQPGARRWKALIFAVTFLTYLPFFFYIKYAAKHYRVYMLLVPELFLAILLLALILFDMRCRQTETKEDSEKIHF